MFKKILPVITGAVGFAFGGPIGASIGAGLGSAVRGDNPANIATSALMGYGLGALGGSMGLVGGKGLGAFGSSLKGAAGVGFQAPSTGVGGSAALSRPALGQAAKDAVARETAKTGLLSQAAQFAKQNKLLTGALGLGALQGLGAFDEEETSRVPPPVEAGSRGMLDISPPSAVFYDTATGRYGATSPTLPPIARVAEGGFPRKTGQISGPGTEKSDDIPAMLSDGEFVMTAKAVRGLGALNGADKDDKLEQRRKGAKMMYDMMDKFEKRVA
jgi:hypothetical protein